MIALYDLSVMPTTFDFALWAVVARTHGETHVRFVYEGAIATGKYPEYLAWRRFGNIVLPVCRLAGLDFSVGKRIKGNEYGYFLGDLEDTYRKFEYLELLRSPLKWPHKGYITITLRESFRNKHRNSNLDAWKRFADYLAKIGKAVIVLPECEQAPLDVEQRMAIYANAEMNLGVSNGPMALCTYSAAPYIMINMCPEKLTDEDMNMKWLFKSQRFPLGGQLSFRNERQIFVWEPDTYENIVAAYHQMMDEHQKEAA